MRAARLTRLLDAGDLPTRQVVFIGQLSEDDGFVFRDPAFFYRPGLY
jgi:hypothetical protein